MPLKGHFVEHHSIAGRHCEEIYLKYRYFKKFIDDKGIKLCQLPKINID